MWKDWWDILSFGDWFGEVGGRILPQACSNFCCGKNEWPQEAGYGTGSPSQRRRFSSPACEWVLLGLIQASLIIVDIISGCWKGFSPSSPSPVPPGTQPLEHPHGSWRTRTPNSPIQVLLILLSTRFSSLNPWAFPAPAGSAGSSTALHADTQKKPAEHLGSQLSLKNTVVFKWSDCLPEKQGLDPIWNSLTIWDKHFKNTLLDCLSIILQEWICTFRKSGSNGMWIAGHSLGQNFSLKTPRGLCRFLRSWNHFQAELFKPKFSIKLYFCSQTINLWK